MPNGSPRILLIRLSSMGDVVLTTPAIRAARERFPDARIAFLTNESYAPLLSANPHLDAVLTLDRQRSNRSPAAFWESIRFIRSERFDVSVDMHRRAKTAALTFLARIRTRIGGTRLDNRRVALDPSAYAGGRALAALAPLEALDGDARLEVVVPPDDAAKADELLRGHRIDAGAPTLGIFPGAGWRPRAWMPERFAEVARRFSAETGGRAVVVGAGNECDLVERIVESVGSSAVPLMDLPLGVLAGIIARCGVFLSNDTGPMHLAVAVGTPTVALFGPGRFERFAPKLPHIAIREPIACSPCKQFRDHCRNNACMQLIQVDAVWRGVCDLTPFPQ
ncbi:glycosyltransferase family 9 protein [Candidatus Poribacteria bacterium]|nr:glycosyltransferase family 9 protein [Candidatus Poribacteria bacterium]